MASYTAAGIANSDSWKTGWKAFAFAMCAFFAPFIFVYQPGVLLIGSFFEIVIAIGTLAFGTIMLTIGLAGYLGVDLNKVERTLCIISGILICLPESNTDIKGFTLGIILNAFLVIKGRN